eukprot:3551779-Pyramimonas_sp.AAC.1
MDSRTHGKSSGKKWETGHRVRKEEGNLGVKCAPLPLLAQEDPNKRSLEPNEVVYGGILAALERSKKVDAARELFHEMIADG